MATCVICHFATPLDDVALARGTDRCVCLRCFARETGGAQPMPRTLQLLLTATLAACEA